MDSERWGRMRHLLNHRVQQLQMSSIREFSDRVKEIDNGINLTIGQPDFPTFDHIKHAGKNAIDRDKTSYTHHAGMPELREAASTYMKQKYGLTYSGDHEVLIMNGATQALDTVFRTILQEGCEVILPGPAYPGYEPLIKMCGAKPVFIDTSNHDFKMTADLIEDHFTEKTRCVLLSYPSNPVGTILTKNELGEIARFLREKDTFIVSDEIYSELIYEEDHHSIASFPEVRNQTIVINGLSKSHSMTGWRIGLLFGPNYVIKELMKVHLFNTTCACSISQEAAIEALTNDVDAPSIMREAYKKRRDYVYNRLHSIGLRAIKPQAAFYIFPSIAPFHMRSFDFATMLLDTEHVAVVPGAAFSAIGENYIRISYANSMDVLKEGLDRIERFVNALKENTISQRT